MNLLDRVAKASTVLTKSIGGYDVTMVASSGNVEFRMNIDRTHDSLSPVDSDVVVQLSIGVVGYADIDDFPEDNQPAQNKIIVEKATGETHRIAFVKRLESRFQIFCESH